LALQFQLTVARFNRANGLGSLLINKLLCLIRLLSHDSLLVRLLTFGGLELHSPVGLNGACGMTGELGGMALDLKVLVLGSRAQTSLLLLGIFIDFVLKLVGFVRNLLEGEVGAAEERQERLARPSSRAPRERSNAWSTRAESGWASWRTSRLPIASWQWGPWWAEASIFSSRRTPFSIRSIHCGQLRKDIGVRAPGRRELYPASLQMP